MKCYGVIDTNVLVSALLSRNKDAATVQLLECVFKKEIVPVYSKEIIEEYWRVLNRPKFKFSQDTIRHTVETIVKYGVSVQPTPTGTQLADMKDLVFYEVVMEKRVDDTYLVTGNLKHFPKRTYIVTARQMLDVLHEREVQNLEQNL